MSRGKLSRSPPAFLALLTGLIIAGCGDGEESGPDFTEADLARLTLAPDEAPAGTRYLEDASGPSVLEKKGDEAPARELSEAGMLANHGARFEASSPQAKLGAAETMSMLAADEDAAGRLLDSAKEVYLRSFDSSSDFPTGALGAESWGVRGELGGAPAVALGWRMGDVVAVATVSPNHGDGMFPIADIAHQVDAKAQE